MSRKIIKGILSDVCAQIRGTEQALYEKYDFDAVIRQHRALEFILGDSIIAVKNIKKSQEFKLLNRIIPVCDFQSQVLLFRITATVQCKCYSDSRSKYLDEQDWKYSTNSAELTELRVDMYDCKKITIESDIMAGLGLGRIKITHVASGKHVEVDLLFDEIIRMAEKFFKEDPTPVDGEEVDGDWDSHLMCVKTWKGEFGGIWWFGNAECYNIFAECPELKAALGQCDRYSDQARDRDCSGTETESDCSGTEDE